MLAGFGEFYGSEADRFGLSRNAVVGQPKPEFAGALSAPQSPSADRDFDAEIAAARQELEEIKRQREALDGGS